jgi:hypothetical protein
LAAQLESTLFTASPMDVITLSGSHTSTVSPITQQAADPAPRLLYKDSDRTAADIVEPEPPADVEEDNNVDAMGAPFTAFPTLPKERGTIFGQSSLASLVSHVAHGSGNLEHIILPHSSHKNSPPRQVLMPPKRIRRFSLPSRRDADQLLNHFWNNVHLFYPWIHSPSFLKAYDRLWTRDGVYLDARDVLRVGLGGRGCSEVLFHTALNAIFALGCEVANSQKPEGEQAAIEFMDRVDDLFQISLLDEDDLSVVQTLLLIAIYLQSTQNPMKCWGVAGLAIRMAQGIGLHLNHTYARYTFVEAELRRRVWHGCLLLDR